MASVIIISGSLHAASILLVERCTSFSFSYGDLLTLLAAQSGNPFKDAIEHAVKFPRATFAYFATIYAFAACSGYILRIIVRKCRLYLFRDLEPDVSGTWVNAVVDVGNRPYLFSGIVDDFHVDKEGGLDRIILIEASQQQVNEDNAPEQDQQEEIQSVEGKLVLRYSAIKTMTVVKFSLEEES